MPQDNPWLPLLDDSDFGSRLSFFSRVPQRLSGSSQRAAQSLYQPTLNQFQGQLGQQLRSGQTPSLTFEDFLNSYGFDRMLKRETTPNNSGLTSPTTFNW